MELIQTKLQSPRAFPDFWGAEIKYTRLYLDGKYELFAAFDLFFLNGFVANRKTAGVLPLFQQLSY